MEVVEPKRLTKCNFEMFVLFIFLIQRTLYICQSFLNSLLLLFFILLSFTLSKSDWVFILTQSHSWREEKNMKKTHNKVAKLRFPNATNIYFPVDDETKIIQLKTLHWNEQTERHWKSESEWQSGWKKNKKFWRKWNNFKMKRKNKNVQHDENWTELKRTWKQHCLCAVLSLPSHLIRKRKVKT